MSSSDLEENPTVAFGEASPYLEIMFKRELFIRLFSQPERINDAEFCWAMVQRAWLLKPKDC